MTDTRPSSTVNGTGTANVFRMAPVRRARGTGLDNVTLKVDVNGAAKALCQRVAKHKHMSLGQATEYLLNSLPLDADGLPMMLTAIEDREYTAFEDIDVLADTASGQTSASEVEAHISQLPSTDSDKEAAYRKAS